MFRQRLVSLLVAYLLDSAAGEPPPAAHPVVWVGRLLDLVEGLVRPRGRRAELIPGFIGLGAAGLGSWVFAAYVQRGVNRLPGAAAILAEAMALKPAFAARMLWAEALTVAELLEVGDLSGARRRVRSLVSRPTAGLPAPLVASAAVESVAENLTDSIVAPTLAYLVAGLPGAYFYRVVNTADARWGYRGRFEFFGKAAARLDDLFNFVPARLVAALLLAAGLIRGEDFPAGLKLWLRDGGRTASPNAGQTMSAMAGLLGVRLEKPGHYILGKGLREPTPADIRRAVRTARAAGWALVVGLAGFGFMSGFIRGWRCRRRPF